MKNLSIIIPTLNESVNINRLLQRISGMASVFTYAPEILFVDDGSVDGTRQKIEEYNGSMEVRLLCRNGEKGLAGAVIHGARNARHDNLVVMDADLSHEPESIPELVEPLFTDKFDMVIGSRYMEGGRIEDWPIMRKAGSKLASLPAHFLTGVEDPLSGFFGIKRSLLLQIEDNTAGFKIGLEILRLQGDNIRVKEIPILFKDRQGGKSKMKYAVVHQYLHHLLSCFGVKKIGDSISTLLLVGCLAALFDGLLFFWMTSMGIATANAHFFSFLLTGHIFFLPGCLILQPPNRLLIIIYRHLLIILLPAMFIRGGLLSIMLSHIPSLHTTSILLGFFTFLSWLCFALTSDRVQSRKSIPNGAILTIIILYSLLLRLIYLGTTELIQEEAYYWNYAQHMDYGYLDHPPIVAALIWLGTTILGNTELAIRLGAYLCWFVTAAFSYKLTKSMYGAKESVYAVFLLAILPIFFGSSLVMTPDAPLLACWAASLYFLHRALAWKSKKAWIGAGTAVGLGLASKYTIVLLGPATLLYLLIDKSSRRWLATPMPYLSLAVAVFFFTPVLWWNVENNWVSFLFQSHSRIAEDNVFTTHLLLSYLLLLITPAGAVAAILALFPKNFPLTRQGLVEHRQSSPYLFTLIMTAVPFLVFFLFSFRGETKLNWTGPIWLMMVPFMAHLLVYSTQKNLTAGVRLLFGSWAKTAPVLLILYGASLHYLSLGLPGVPYLKNNILLGWDDLATKIESTATEVQASTGRKPVIVGMDKYRIASGVSFYIDKASNKKLLASKPLATGRHLFGLESLMFSHWHPSVVFSHQDLLLIAQNKNQLHPYYFKGKAMKLGEIEELTVTKHGRIVATYYYRILNGYLPADPEKVAMQQIKVQ